MAKDIKDELIGLERRYWQALVDQDVETATALTADRSILTGAQGVNRFSKDDFRKMMSSDMGWELKSFELKDVEVERLSDDVAVIGYKVHEDMVVDGKPLSLDAAESSTWVRRNGAWECAMHTESVLGDPFGRDRVSA